MGRAGLPLRARTPHLRSHCRRGGAAVLGYRREMLSGPKPRLCIVSPFEQGGGAEYQMSLLIDALAAADRYDIHYLAHVVDERARIRNYRVSRIGGGGPTPRMGYLMDARPLYRTLRDIDPCPHLSAGRRRLHRGLRVLFAPPLRPAVVSRRSRHRRHAAPSRPVAQFLARRLGKMGGRIRRPACDANRRSNPPSGRTVAK